MIQWTTSIDFNNMSDVTSSLVERNDIIYLSFHSNKQYLCVIAILPTNGDVIKYSCLGTPSPLNSDGNGRFTIIMISQKYLIGKDYIQNNSNKQKLIIYNLKTLVPSKIYSLVDLYLVNCITSDDIQSKFICVNRYDESYSALIIDDQLSIIFQTFFIPNLNLGTVFYNNNIISKTNSRILLSYTLNPIYMNSSLSAEVITNKFDLNMNTLTCETYNKADGVAVFTEITFGNNTPSFDYFILNTSLNIQYNRDFINFNKFEEIDNLGIIDIEKCIWPRFETFKNNCSYQLPNFNLKEEYSFKIGKNINLQRQFVLTPYVHPQKAKFIISVIDSLYGIQPDWISIDQQYENITLNTINITTVSSYNIIFSSRLFTYTYDNLSKISTSNFFTTFNFINNNCNLLSSNYSNYLVLNKIKEINFEFEDDEEDNTIVRVYSKSEISSFVKYSNSSTATILIQLNSVDTNSTIISFSYTDSYHQKDEYWQFVSFQFLLFASEPPVFDTYLNSISVNKCQNYLYLLPTFSDPDSNNITAKLGEGTPNWISMNKNFTISLNSKSGNSVKEGLTQVDIVLIDETNSWTKYSINITVDQLSYPVFLV